MNRTATAFVASCAAVACATAFFGVIVVAQAQVYPAPAGGWSYLYDGGSAAGGADFSALDGTWSHDDGSDEWDESAIGSGSPGGASSLTDDSTYLRLQDTGDPRDYGIDDPGSNRKLYFGHDISAEGATDSILDDGMTVSFRARLATDPPLDDLHPDGGGGITPWPAEGDGYLIHDGGKGNFTVKQASGGAISFSLANAGDGAPGGALLTNNLNGTTVTGDVDSGEEGDVNLLDIEDPTAWHEFWITVQAGGAGTHQVSIYQDGSLVPTVLDVTAGSGSDFSDISYIAMGVGSTGQSGALDIDFFGWAPGAAAPVPEPSTAAIALLGLAGLVGWSAWNKRGR